MLHKGALYYLIINLSLFLARSFSYLCLNMKLFSCLLCVFLGVLLSPLPAFHPEGFELNRGQIRDESFRPSEVPFLRFSAEGFSFFLTSEGFVYSLYQLSSDAKGEKSLQRCSFFLVFENTSILPSQIQPFDTLQKRIYYTPNGRTETALCKQVRIRNLYPSIDLLLYITEKHTLKYDFILHKGANPSLLQFSYYVAQNVSVKNDSTLSFHTNLGILTEKEVIVKKNGKQLSCRRHLLSHHPAFFKETFCQQYTFSYQLANELTDIRDSVIIDPEVEWFTFIGGNESDAFYAADTDADGNTYLGGYSISVNFPVSNNNSSYFQSVNYGSYISCCGDMVITKINPQGQVLWSTFYGGTGGEFIYGLKVSKDQSVFATGNTYSVDFPLQNKPGAYFQSNYTGGWDGVIIKFDAQGMLEWATYLGGSQDEYGHSIDQDTAGNIYLTGISSSNDWFLNNLTGNYQQTQPAGGLDAFIISFTLNGAYRWGTFLGGSDTDFGTSVSVSPSGKVYVTGYTRSDDFPVFTTGKPLQIQRAGNFDTYLAEFDLWGNRVWITYYGGSDNDLAYSIATDNQDHVILTGYTASQNLPLKNAGFFFQSVNQGNYDIFISRFDNNGSLTWASLIGSSQEERFMGCYDHLAVDSCGNMYMAFTTNSPDLPAKSPCDESFTSRPYQAQHDIYAMAFSSQGKLLWSSYLGGNGNDFKSCLSLIPHEKLIIGGEASNVTFSSSYPVAGSSLDTTYNGDPSDAFVMSIRIPSTSPLFTITPDCDSTCSGSITLTAPSCDFSLYMDNTTPLPSFLCAGSYTFYSVSENCIIQSHTLTIEYTKRPEITLCCDTVIPPGTSILLEVRGNHSFTWYSGEGITCNSCPFQQVYPSHTQRYCVLAGTSHCHDSACIEVRVDEHLCDEVFVPNIFSPNHDQQNDRVQVMSPCIENIYFIVHDRWGNRVFETIDKNDYWDGSYHDYPSPEGVYYYFLRATLLNQTTIERKGTITLIR